MGEFEFIERIKRQFRCPDGVVGIGDDCAVIPMDSARDSLVSCDMLMEGVHFLRDDISPYQLGWKSAAVNISDVAAMGGRPEGTFLSIALPSDIDDKWKDEFVRGYKALSSKFSCPLLGGDTSASLSGICINVTVLGSCAHAAAKRRDMAQEGDAIYVSNYLGDSASGLQAILKRRQGYALNDEYKALIDKHYLPEPRVELSSILALRDDVHAMMDISDGVASDLRHILASSSVGAEVEISSLPCSELCIQFCAEYGFDPVEMALCGGEDYELLLTASASFDPAGLPLTRIGTIVSGSKIDWVGSSKDFQGYRHLGI